MGAKSRADCEGTGVGHPVACVECQDAVGTIDDWRAYLALPVLLL